MKKILCLLLFIFVSIMNVSASDINDQFYSTFIGNYHYVDKDGKFGDFEIFKRTSDGKIAYCIEPGVPLTHDFYQGYENLPIKDIANIVGISSKQLTDITYYSYYGYGYQNHNDVLWIIATQVRIWEILGRPIQFTSRNSAANPFQYVIDTPLEINNKMIELDTLVSKHKEKPSFHTEKFFIPCGETLILKDSILNTYQLKFSSNEVILKDDTLSITPINNQEEEEIILERKNDYWSSSFIVYHHLIGQNLILSGNLFHDEIRVFYEGVTGSFLLQKFDEETKKCFSNFATSLENAVYGLYSSSGNLITKLVLNNCQALATNLSVGEYYVQEIEAPLGYQLDKTKYLFSITKDNINKTQSLTVYDSLKKVSLKIHKDYLEDENVILPEENATFDIFKKSTNQKIGSLKTDKFGNGSINLPYDTYLIRQTSGKYNYKFVKDEVFTIDNSSKEEISFSFLNEPILKKVKVMKVEKKTNNRIFIPNVTFKIYDLERKKYVCENTDCTYKTNEWGEFITKDLFPSSYQLEEIPQKIPNLLWNPQKITFQLDQNSLSVTEILFANDVATGTLEIEKRNEWNEAISNVSFGLYAAEDIFDIHNKLLSKKDSLVAKLITNDEGFAFVSLLPLGNYYLKELQTDSQYLLDSNTYPITLSYIDENTPIVKKQIQLINYSVPKTKKDSFLFPLLILMLGGVCFYEKKYFFTFFTFN